MPVAAKNLSDQRGNALGIGFFRVVIRALGPRCACAMVWFVAFFYAVCDGTARRAATPYLRSRFPKAGTMARRWHFYRLIVAQGQVIILAHWLRSGRQVPIREEQPEHLRDALCDRRRGLILLISHVGCWQAALTYLENYQRPVNLLIQANANVHIAKMFLGQHVTIINNDGPFGGLLDCVAALERGEIVCIMGDRQAGDHEEALPMTLLGRQLFIPRSPWLLAARCRCAIVPVFTLMRGMAGGIDFFFAPPITIEYNLPRKPPADIFTPYIAQYAAALEKMAVDHPYQLFHYDHQASTATPRET